MKRVPVKIKRLHPDAVIPKYATDGSAGFDLVAVEDVLIYPGETKKIPLGIAFEIPEGYEIQIRPRSGISLWTKLRQSNSVGTIDSDYRGEVAMIFDNLHPVDDCTIKAFMPFRIDGTPATDEEWKGPGCPFGTYLIRKGDRIAQGVLKQFPIADFIEVDELSETERGQGGFGSTGRGV